MTHLLCRIPLVLGVAWFLYCPLVLTVVAQDCPYPGDVNLDGRVTPADAHLAFQEALAQLDPPLQGCQRVQANVHEPADPRITPADALCIFQSFLTLPSCLDQPAPTPPQDVMAVAEHGDGTVTLTWSASPEALSYTLYWAEGDDVSLLTGTRVANVSSPYVHADRIDHTTYSYILTAVNLAGESEPSRSVQVTPRPPRLAGNTRMPPLEVRYANDLNAGGVSSICLYDLAWEAAVDCDDEADPNCHCDIVTAVNPDTGQEEVVLTEERRYSFTVQRDRAYIVLVQYGGGQALAALTPTVTADTVQDVTLESEIVLNLISVLEREHHGVDPADLRPLAPRLDTLRVEATMAVEKLQRFYEDRGNNREADRVTEAVRSFTLDRLNQSGAVSVSELVTHTIRAYGGGLGPLRTLSTMLTSPSLPLNPHFTFTRQTNQTFDTGMSDLETVRWDYLANEATSPHIPVGGTKVVYAARNGRTNAGGYHVQGVFLKTLGQEARILVTPENMYAITPSLSPDQTRLAFAGFVTDLAASTPISGRTPYNIFIVDIDPVTNERRDVTQITFDPAFPSEPLGFQGNFYTDWSPDGEWLVFARQVRGQGDTDPVIDQIIKIRYDGSERAVLVDAGASGITLSHAPKWSADAREILFAGIWPGETHYRVLGTAADVIPAADRLFTRYTDGSRDASQSALSYDGRFIMYAAFGEERTATLHIVNRYTGALVADLGNFAQATSYLYPRFTGTEAVLVAVEGTMTDASGTVDIAATSGTDNRTTPASGSTSSYNYYREIIPTANASGINFNVTSWW